MIRIQLDDTTRDELRRLRHTHRSDTARDRLEMVLLSDAGWSPPRIARHLGCHPHTARAALKGYRDRGVAALQPQRPGPPPDQQRRQSVAERLTALLGQERTWTSRQLAEALQPQPPGPPPDRHRRQAVTARLTELLGQRRTWTSRQLAEALRPDIELSPRQVLRYLALLKARYRRTASTVRHKQDPAKVARAKRVLGGLKKKRGRAA